MRFYLGVTDLDWYDFLSEHQPDEVNFWQPNAHTFGVLQPGEPFLFKLKSPLNEIGGGGFFVRQVRLPLSVAWDTFADKNGAASFSEFRTKVLSYRQDGQPNPEIGCIILTEPFFFESGIRVPQPIDWGKSIVQGKSYSTDEAQGAILWQEISMRLQGMTAGVLVESAPEQDAERYGIGLSRHRLGQGAFRALVTEAYQRRCAITGERTLPVLIAAHIKPFAQSGPHDVRNGLLMRSDVHTLFDLGYITVTNTFHLEVSGRIREEFANGREYYALHGKSIMLPTDSKESPAVEFLEWHNQNIFLP